MAVAADFTVAHPHQEIALVGGDRFSLERDEFGVPLRYFAADIGINAGLLNQLAPGRVGVGFAGIERAACRRPKGFAARRQEAKQEEAVLWVEYEQARSGPLAPAQPASPGARALIDNA